MKVKLLSITQDAMKVMYIAARTCYSKLLPEDMFKQKYTDEKIKQLLDKVLGSGHESIAEHVNFTFSISGISRACSHQLVRHRHCTFSQQSQRYVEIKEDFDELTRLRDLHTSKADEKLQEIAKKYFVDVTCDNYRDYIDDLISYTYHTQINNDKAEDARMFLPNATKTNLVMTCNLRELMHMCNLRLCTRAQTEIRNVFKEIKKEVFKENEYLASFLKPSCEINGYCPEDKCCGRKPRLEDLIGNNKKL